MKLYIIRTSKQADKDIENLHDFIYEKCKSPLTSKRYIEGILSQLKTLTRSAESYPISTVKSIYHYGFNARAIYYRKMTIIYTIHGRTVLIKRIIPSALINEL